LNSEISECPTSVLYREFLHIFEQAYKDPNYYILDFKCGVYKNEPIRWSYKKLLEGEQTIDGKVFSFQECLLMDDDSNTIKLDICFLYNNIFTDINCLYFIHHVINKNKKKKAKAMETKLVSKQLLDEIKELEKNKEYFKSMKRHFL
jgi:hypothetical protein